MIVQVNANDITVTVDETSDHKFTVTTASDHENFIGIGSKTFDHFSDALIELHRITMFWFADSTFVRDAYDRIVFAPFF